MNGNDLVLEHRTDKFYSVEDCYNLCVSDKDCSGFITVWGDSRDQFCRTLQVGCAADDYEAASRAYYSLNRLTGLHLNLSKAGSLH